MFRILLTTIIVTLASPGWGTQVSSPVKPFVFNYDKRTYPGDNQNWSVAVDSRGFLYAGNQKGLLEFDGSSWNLYSMPDNGIVRSVAIGKNGRIYVGSFEEFGYMDEDITGRKHYISLSDSLKNYWFHNDEIWRIILHKGKVYFQSFSTLFIYDHKEIKVIQPESAFVLLMKARNRLFIHRVNKGLYEITEGELKFIPGSEVFYNNEIRVMIPFEKQSFLVGTVEQGMFVYNGKEFSRWEAPVNEILMRSEINRGLVTDNRIILGTIVNGLFILDKYGNLLNHINSDNFLQNNTVLGLCSDNENNFWVGLDKGLDHVILNSIFDSYFDQSGNIGAVYSGALLDKQLFVGTNQGLFRYNFIPGQGFISPIFVDNSQGQVWQLKKIGDELICGHTNGTYRITDKGLTKVSSVTGGFDIKPFPGEYPGYQIQSTYTTFVIYKESEAGLNFSHELEGFVEPVSHFEFDNYNNIWASHFQKGIYTLTLNKDIDSVLSIKYYGQSEGFPSEHNINLARIQNRIVFTTGELIYTWDDLNDSIVLHKKMNNSLGKFCGADKIIEAVSNNYWFIKDNNIALFLIDKEKIAKIFEHKLDYLEGFLLSNYPNIITLNDSLYMICLDNGFALLNKKNFELISNRVEVTLREVKVYSRQGEVFYFPLEKSEASLKLSNSLNNLEFTFAAGQNCMNPVFRHKLAGLEMEWSEWSAVPRINYTRLPAGEYEFIVQTESPGGLISNPVNYPFTILKPWYISLVAVIFYTVIFVCCVIILRLMFLRRLKKHKVHLELEEQKKRKNDMLLAEKKFFRLRNEKLSAEISYKSKQLANSTMSIINKNESLLEVRNELIKQKKELGTRYPDYYYRKLERLIDKNISNKNDWKIFEIYFDQAHQNFFKRLKNDYPKLTPSDLRFCAYLRINLSSKEIAPMLNISLRGIEVKRYRLRQRLGLQTEENLVEFIMQF